MIVIVDDDSAKPLPDSLTVVPIGPLNGTSVIEQIFTGLFPFKVPKFVNVDAQYCVMVPVLDKVVPWVIVTLESGKRTRVTPDGMEKVPELMVSAVWPPRDIILPDFMLKVPELENDPV